MPQGFSRSPQILKGAFAIYASQTPGTQPKTIVFQYNPDQVKRTLAARTQPPDKGNAGGAKEEANRVFGPPIETVNLSIALNAADQLENPDANRSVVEDGLHPVLATLELLLYPSTDTTNQQRQQAQQGKAQVNAADLPVTLLVWGKSRVAPVQITSFSVTEEAFDVNLNPIQVKIELALKVLTEMELQPNTIGMEAWLAYHREKENLALRAQPYSDDDRIRGFLPS
jgi:hypothetical protein